MHRMPDGSKCSTVIFEVSDQRTTMLNQRNDARFDHFEQEGGRVWAYRKDGDEWSRIYCGWSDQAEQNIAELGTK